jgi:quercetin dioxygenase-like cupin family protein
MKIIKSEDLGKIENPSPAQPYRMEINLDGDGFKSLGGVFGLLAPGSQVPYHYHKDRESILIPLCGEAVEIVEGKETVVRPGDVLLIPARENHATVNRSDREFRYVEFFTCPPLSADFVKVE